jgi:hypothetical protein
MAGTYRLSSGRCANVGDRKLLGLAVLKAARAYS